jgi:hypothetical protein
VVVGAAAEAGINGSPLLLAGTSTGAVGAGVGAGAGLVAV